MINFAHWALENSQQYLSKIAYHDGAESLTYADLRQQVINLAGHFGDLQLAAGDVVIIHMEDCIDWPVVFLACLYTNVIPLPLSSAVGATLFYQIADFVNCKHCFMGDSLSQRYSTAIPITTREQVRKIKLVSAQMPPKMVHPDSAAWMNISSGSTGFPKIAVHRHQTLFEILKLSPAVSYGMHQDSVMMSVAKMSWNFGLHNSITYTLGLGATAVVIPEAPVAPVIFDYLQRYQPTIVITSPAIVQRLIKSKDHRGIPDSVKHFHSSGEHLAHIHYAEFERKFGIKINCCIGMMETCTNYAANPDWAHDPGTVGVALPGVDIKLIDSQGQTCQHANDVGEIWINSPANACYYYNNYDKTRATFQGQWVQSGDLAYWNNRGNLTFVGRVDDSFKVSDLIVNPVEVENALLNFASIEQVAVIGKANEKNTIEVHAFVIPKTGFDRVAFDQYCKTVLFSHQLPRHVHLVNDLPETVTNKKDRRSMRMKLPLHVD